MLHTQREFLAFGFKAGDEPVQMLWAVKSALLFCEHFQVAQSCNIIGGAINLWFQPPQLIVYTKNHFKMQIRLNSKA